MVRTSARLAALLPLFVASGRALAQESAPASRASAPSWSEVQERGFRYLLTQQREGSFAPGGRAGDKPDVGLSALALAALLTKPQALRDQATRRAIESGLAFLVAQQDESGSFGGRVPNYNTCACILALVSAGDPKHANAIRAARRHVLAIQHAEGNGYAASDPDYGGIGYGREGRGDLSNVAFAIEALRASGVPPQDDAMRRAIVFLQRTQNLRAVNDVKHAGSGPAAGITTVSGDDGGAGYYPGNSPMGYVELAEGQRAPRSYGSMTYALLKTYLLAGVPAEDPRVVAALRWIERHFTVEHNPGADPTLGEKAKYSGLYYQYMLMARALSLAGIDALRREREGANERIAWREVLRVQLAKTQRQDGSWVNERDDRWWENLPVLATSYALLALHDC